MSAEESPRRGRWYWENYSPKDRYAGADLAILRQGMGQVVGDVWQMSRFYRSAPADGQITHRLAAEHATLALFAVHQQSQPVSMHRAGTELGAAARRLHRPKTGTGSRSPHTGAESDRSRGKYSEAAVDRRMNQIATATDVDELVAHLRGLVTLLHTIGQPLDYTRLHREIERWHYPDARAAIRARWGHHYFDNRPTPSNAT